MILIDMPMPKRCEWLDDNHNLKSCPLLGDEDNCKLQDCKEFWTWEDQYGGCPLHEVTADEDTISRKQAIEPFMDNLDDWMSYDVRKILESLPPSPNAQKALDDNSQHVQNVESVGNDFVSRQAEPQTTEWLMGGVSYINEESVYCSKCRWAWSKKEDLGFFEYCPNCGRKILYRGKWRKVSKNESQGGAV